MIFFPTINSVYVMIGSLILGAAGGMLGCFAVLRKQGLLGDALAHASLPGIAIAFLIVQVKVLPVLLLGALISGLIGAFCINILVSKTKIKMDTAMAAVLSVFFGLGILLLTYIQKLPIASQSGLDVFLFGQAASLLKDDVFLMAGAFVLILLVILLFWKELKLFIFDSEYARVLGFRQYALEILFMTIFVVAILMALQAVGVVLTAALFITPAVAALLWTNRLLIAVVLSTFFGMIAGGSGAFVSSIFAKMPTGPVIVLVTTTIFIISFIFAPKKGVFSKWLRHYNRSQKVQTENVLGRLYRDFEQGNEVWKKSDYKAYGYKTGILKILKKKGFVKTDGEDIFLTKSGIETAKSIVEKHRLWETYLVHELRLAPDHVHRDAEEMEHVLTPEMIEKLRIILKDPKVDPHGKPIK